ncbi:MAG: GTP pyrophosphokinase [Acidimicrobiales bacterium]
MASIDGVVCDTQKSYDGTVAHFFLEQFLGCLLREKPELTTKRFFEATERFINEEVAEPEKKAQYQVALLAELNRTRDKVSVRAFANNNFAIEDRQAFMDEMDQAQLPKTRFDKDTHLVQAHLRRIQMALRERGGGARVAGEHRRGSADHRAGQRPDQGGGHRSAAQDDRADLTMADLDALRQRYLTERPAYAALAEDVAGCLRAATRRSGLICEVEGRAKDVASFLKKALRKEYASPGDDIHDKATARVVTVYESQVEEVEDLVRELFVVHHHEDKRHSLAPDTLSYLGVHFEVSLSPDVAGAAGAEGRLCEIQVHTRAHNLWATVSHELLYKPAQAPPGEVTRSIYRLMALLELFDGEVARGRQQIQDHPGYEEARMLDTLERQFYALAGRHAEIELSRRLVSALAPALSSEEAAGYEATLVLRRRKS